MTYNNNDLIAIRRWSDGEKYACSTSIAGYTTYGYGELDNNGFWEYEIPGWMIEYPKLIEKARKYVKCIRD